MVRQPTRTSIIRGQTRTTLAKKQIARQRPIQVSRVPFPEEKIITEVTKEVSDLVKEAGVSSAIAIEALNLAQRKLSGRRIPFRDDPDLSRAVAIVFNRPEFLRERSGFLGRRSPKPATQTLLSQSFPEQVQDFASESDLIRSPRLTVEAVPSVVERFKTAIREERPDLKFIPNDKLERGVEALVGTTFGTSKILKEELRTRISQLRTAEGGFVFTKKEAKGLSDLSFEIGENLLLGKGAGKISTLARGGFLASLPQGLKNSNKFKKVIQVGDLALLGTLGTAEGLRIKTIFENEGSNKALLEVVGLISFGIGFGKTGLSSDRLAEAEFKKFVKTLSDASIKGKRGQVALGRKRKKKKGELQLLNDLIDLEEAEKLRNVIGEIERRLLNEKNIEGQKKIIAELKKGIKTPEAKKEFNEFILSLIEKNILKIPKVEVAPGIIQEGFLPNTKGFSTMSKLNRERLTKNLQKNNARIDRAKLSVSERVKVGGSKLNQERVRKAQVKNDLRIKLAQMTPSQRLELMQRLRTDTKFSLLSSTAQRQNARSKQLQEGRLMSAQIIQQKSKIRQLQFQKANQRTLQKERLKLATLLKSLQTFRQKLKTPTRLKPKAKPKPRKIRGFPFLLKTKKKGKVSVKKKVQKKKQFKVFARRKGIDRLIGRTTTKKKASRLLRRTLDNRIIASGFIQRGKKKLVPKISKRFRISKIDNFRLVERKKFRLSSRKEVSQINSAKRNKAKPFKSKSPRMFKKR